MTLDLRRTTLIVPVLVESEDRARNVETVLGHLDGKFRTRVIIKELYVDAPKVDAGRYKNLDITHLTERFEGEFHRTRLLNDMLQLVRTPVVCNYDIDVLLPTESYVIAQHLLASDLFDVVYPYGIGDFQVKVDADFDRARLDDLIGSRPADLPGAKASRAEYGHCMFFSTDSYKSIGGENENFVAYGPEDAERHARCEKLGLRMHRLQDRVYHLEHSRTSFSTTANGHFNANQSLFEELIGMNPQELHRNYAGQAYVARRGFRISTGKNIQPTPEYKQEMKTPPPPVSPPPRIDACACGEPKNRVRYNFCQKCNRLY